MMSLLFGLMAKTGIAEDMVKPATYAAMLVFAIPVLMGVKACYDSSVIEDATNEANLDFTEKLNKSTGEQDLLSDERREAFDKEVRQTEELIDEANEKNCAVADYLNSNGTICLRLDTGEIQRSGTE